MAAHEARANSLVVLADGLQRDVVQTVIAVGHRLEAVTLSPSGGNARDILRSSALDPNPVC